MQYIMMLLKGMYVMNMSKNINSIASNKQKTEKKIKDIDEKLPQTTKIIETQEFNRLSEWQKHWKTLLQKINRRLHLI